MIRRLLGAAPTLARQADARFAAVVLVLSVLALGFSGWLIVDPPIPLDRDLMAMSPRVFPYLILLSTVAVAGMFLGFRVREVGTGREAAGAAASADRASGAAASASTTTGTASPAATATGIAASRHAGSGAAAPPPIASNAHSVAPRTANLRQLAFLVIAVACALLLSTLGFMITTFILMASTSVLVGNRNPLQILGISILIPLGFFIAVTHVMRTALPEIDLVQRALSPLLRLLPAF